MISMICAVGRNREIGFKNRLLWDLKGDMKHFVETTRGKTVIMGETTYHSLFIKPLPGRRNIVLTLDKNLQAPGCEISFDLKAIAEKYKNTPEEVFIIGGASIYKQFLPYADKLYLTLVDDAPEADTFFPDYSEFKIISDGELKEENGIKFKFAELKK
ncbi:MAG: dihydrofolate reductase [Patescibacteria group bacterium]|nr:dihydrofolate reductase [Patescibacteria group bacterium]